MKVSATVKVDYEITDEGPEVIFQEAENLQSTTYLGILLATKGTTATLQDLGVTFE